MAWNREHCAAVFRRFLLVFSAPLLFAQQSSLQTSFFAPAAIRLPSVGISADIAETEHLSYINQLVKDSRKGTAPFQPNASDLLIQQAEERFRAGRKFYQDRDFDRARVEFDAGIDAMLQASDSPTDRSLYECKLEDMVDSIHRFDLTGLGAAAVETEPQFDKAPLEDIVQMTFPVDPKITEKVRTELKNTSSALPLVMNDVVLGYVNYFSGHGRRTIEYGLGRAAKYRPMISKILAEEGVPQELIHLAQAESGFLPRAVSRAAAEGMWQFVKFRGNQYGLMQTPYSDDRFDPEKATRAAARHLHDLYDEFHDWYLAIAAYNCGPGTVEKAVERTGYADYWELRARHALPAETTNYVPIILAMTIMAKNAPEYGLEINPEQPVEYDTIHTSAPTNLALIGDLAEVTVSELQQLNPALLRGVAPGDFDLRVPKGLGQQVAGTLDLIPEDRRGSSRIHRVQEGETLAAIARRYSVELKTIAAANELSGTAPAAGARLVIPTAYREPAPRKAASPAGRRTSAASNRAPSRTPRRSSGKQQAAVHKTVATPRAAAAPAAKKPAAAATLAQVNGKRPSLNR